MTPCEFTSRVGAYRDGEMSSADAARLAEHLPGCDACREELAGLDELTRDVAAWSAPAMSAETWQRLALHVNGLTDRSVLRMVKVLSGLAASVLIIASIGLVRGADASAEPLTPWDDAAVTIQKEAQPAAVYQAADWIVTQLHQSQNDE